VHRRFADADDAFVDACATITKGNPFLLGELLAQIEADGRPANAQTAERLADLVPDAIVSAVLARLGAISAPARALASAVAALGDRVSLADAAGLAELDVRAAAEAAEALSDTHLLAPSLPLSFTHPLIRSAVLASMSPLARGQIHRRAVEILREAGAGAESVATHLLAAPADGDPAAVEELRRAAQRNLTSGDAHSAVRFLERALDEQPPSNVYPDILAELGRAEAQAGLASAPDRLQDAISVTGEPRRRAELALARGRMLLTEHDYRDAAEAFDAGLHERGGVDESLKAALEAGYVAAASLVPQLAGGALERRDWMLGRLDAAPDADQRLSIAQSVMLDSMRGAGRDDVRRLADLAWADGALLRRPESTHDVTLSSLTTALLFADELE